MATPLETSMIRKGSDFLDEDSNMCDPCFFDGQSIPADRFCANCQEKYCTKCAKYHLSLRMSRKHTLLTVDAVNKTHRSVLKDKCSEKCTNHTDKIIKWFCEAHSSLSCSLCTVIDHKQCSNTIYIPTAAADLGNNDEFKKFDGKLRGIEKAFKAGIEDVENVLKHIAADETEMKNAFKTFRKRLNEIVDQLEQDTTEQARTIAREETTKLKQLSKELETSLNEVVGLVNNVDDLLKTGKHCDVFVTMKKQGAQLVRLNDELTNMTRGKNYCRYELRPNEDLVKQTNLGKLTRRTANIDWSVPTVPVLKPHKAEQKPQQAEKKPQQGEKKPQQAQQKPRQVERAVQNTVQTENVSSRGRDQRPLPVDWDAMARRMEVGDRVRRGPHWLGDNEDGRGLGTVARHHKGRVCGYSSWEVSWDCGTRGTTYRMGKGWALPTYELEIV